MLDIELIRKDAPFVIRRLNCRGKDFSDDINRVVHLDQQWRAQIEKTNRLNAERNQLSEQIAKTADKASAQSIKMQEQVKEIKEELQAFSAYGDKISAELEALLFSLPNIPNEKVAIGKSEEDNVVVSH